MASELISLKFERNALKKLTIDLSELIRNLESENNELKVRIRELEFEISELRITSEYPL